MNHRDLLHHFRQAAGRCSLVAFLLLVSVSQAFAHASLTGTSPRDGDVVERAPTSFTLSFSEVVAPLALNLVRPDGETTALDAVILRDRTVEIGAPNDLADGTHVLTWRVVSQDGHPVGGSVIFSIGQPSAAPPPVADPVDSAVRTGLWITRIALYAGLFAGIGGAFAVAWLFPRSRAGTSAAATATLLGLAGTALSPGLQGLDALGAGMTLYFDRLVWMTGMETSYGNTVVAMLAALFFSLFALLATGQRVARVLSLAGLLLGAAALALSGHASAAEPRWLTGTAVLLHSATIALWLGALVPLALALRSGNDEAGGALATFSATIPYALIALVAAGGVLTIIQMQTPSALSGTAYGQLLAAKLILVVIVLAIAGHNRWRLTEPVLDGNAEARRHLVRSITMETILLLVILAVAAGWRFTPPPRSIAIAAAQPAFLHLHTAQAMADVTVTPGRAGPVSIAAILMTGEFGPLDAKEVTFVFSNPDAGIEPFRRPASRPGDGTWRVDDVILPLAGAWVMRIDILVTDFEIARIQGEIVIRP